MAKKTTKKGRSKRKTSRSSRATPDWTVMVYQAGDNSLSEEMVWALKEMHEVCTAKGFDQRAHVVCQIDPRGVPPMVYDSHDVVGAGTKDGHLSEYTKTIPPRRMMRIIKEMPEFDEIKEALATLQKVIEPRVTEETFFSLNKEIGKALAGRPDLPKVKEKLRKAIEAVSLPDKRKIKEEIDTSLVIIDRVEDFCCENSAAPEMVEDFVGEYLDADSKTLLVLSGHGSGALGDFLSDQDPQNSISIPKLRKALEKATARSPNIDILGMDSCLMSMVEVAYELKHVVRYLVGAEGYVQNTGWPYKRILEGLIRQREPEELAIEIVEKYNLYYRDYEIAGISTDHTVCDLEKINEPSLKGAIEELAGLLIGSLNRPMVTESVVLAHWDAQSYKNEQYVDLWDFCHLLEKRLKSKFSEIITAASKVRHIIDEIVLKSCFTGPEYQHSHGLSIYFPWSAFDYLPEYENLRFARETRWAEFLKEFLETTRRSRRICKLKDGEKKVLTIGVPDDPLTRTGVLSPRTGELSPRTGVLSPRTGVLSPRTGELSPRTGELSPRTGELSPRKKTQSWTIKNRPYGFHRDPCAKNDPNDKRLGARLTRKRK